MKFRSLFSIVVLWIGFGFPAAGQVQSDDGGLSYEPYALAQLTDEARYPEATQPEGTVSRHGEIEYLGNNIFGIHWFIEASGAVWHLVTAGDPKDEVILFVHGHPDTWWSWTSTMSLLADDYYVVAVDTIGSGQSDKRLELDLSYAGVAKSLGALMDTMKIKNFNLVGHDRGAVVGDNMVAIDGLNSRILAYLRMQQSADQPHGLPRPAHDQMKSAEFHGRKDLVYDLFNSEYYSVDIPKEHRDRAAWEFGFPGAAEALAQQFESASFDGELTFRINEVFPRMNMPVVFMQGAHDPGQRPEEFFRTADVVPNGRVLIVDANHFIQAEVPELVAQTARELFD